MKVPRCLGYLFIYFFLMNKIPKARNLSFSVECYTLVRTVVLLSSTVSGLTVVAYQSIAWHRCFLCVSAALFLNTVRKWRVSFPSCFCCNTAWICFALRQRLLCLGYSRAEELCKEYRQTKGPGTTAKPSEQLFFLKLGGLIKNTLEKCQRENGFMWDS